MTEAGPSSIRTRRARVGRGAREADGTTSRLIERMDALQALREPWNELVAASDADAVFTRHEWFEQWIRAYGVESALAVQTTWRDGQLVGVAPLHRSELVFRGLRTRSLAWLWSAVAPRCNLLVAHPDDVPPLLDAVVATPAWDVLVAENLPLASAVTERLLAELAARGRRHQVVETFRSPYRILEEDYETFWKGLDRERRRYLQKKCINRLERQEGVETSTLRTRAELEAFLPDMYALSARSWKADLGSGLGPESPEARLLVGFARTGLERGWVRIDTLRLAGRLLAFEYMLVSGGRYAVARSDYDPEDKYLTPGNSLRLRILRSLLDDPAATEYDLAGGDAPYKREWCNAIRPHVTLTVGNDTLRGRVVLTAKNVLLPALRRLRPGAREEAPA